MGDFVKIASVSDVASGSGKVVQAQDKSIALFNVDGTFYAIDNTCAHRGGPLGEGSLEGAVVTCPWHGWEYDVTKGECSSNPPASVTHYAVKVEGSDVLVNLG